MTWKDIKLATLQKMFAADGVNIPTDGSADDYLAGMPFAANEAINMLSTVGKYLIKSYVIKHDSSGEWKYDLKKLVDDFYDISRVFYITDKEYTEYKNYRYENGFLLLSGVPSGEYTIYYKAYPQQIDYNTEDNYELPLDPEVVVLLPLYMASQLYKEDDNGIATSYRNEFEVAFERLVNNSDSGSYEFTSESGWI